MNQKTKVTVKDQMNLTERAFRILSELAENEIMEWTTFYNNLQKQYGQKSRKGVAKNTKGRGLGKKV